MIIVVISGILAALVLFRWTRTLALLAIAGFVIAMALQSNHAHSEELDMAVCRINSHYQLYVRKGMCAVFEEGARRIDRAETKTIFDCAQYVKARTVSSDPRYYQDLTTICQAIWASKVTEYAERNGPPPEVTGSPF